MKSPLLLFVLSVGCPHGEFPCRFSVVREDLKIVIPDKLDVNDHDIVDLVAFLHCSWSRSLLLSGCFK